MKNIYLIPTDKPSRLYKNFGILYLVDFEMVSNPLIHNQYIYITNDEDIKEGERGISVNDALYTHYDYLGKNYGKKIILTDNPKLIADGIQKIPDDFLEWFVNNSECESVEVDTLPDLQSWNESTNKCDNVYEIIIPQDQPKPILGVDFEFSIDDDGLSIEIPIQPKQTIEEVVEKEVEISYPVLTHSDLENSPYREFKETFKHGVRQGYNHAHTEIEVLTEKIKIADNVIEQLVDNNSKLKKDKEELLDFIKSFIKDFETDYVMDNGDIVDNPDNILIINYKIGKRVITKHDGK